MERKKNAYALIVVLWSIVILTIIFVNLIDEAKLNNLLVRNNITSKELQQAAVNGVQQGINALKNDKTLSDTNKDEWVKPQEYEMAQNITCRVKVSDIGSKLNINYSSEETLRGLQEEFKWDKVKWSKLAEKLVGREDKSASASAEKIALVADLKMMKSEFKSAKDYQQFKELFTAYGQFNINVHQAKAFRKLLYFLQDKFATYQLNQRTIDTAVKTLDKQNNSDANKRKKRADNFNPVQNFLEQAFPSEPSLRKKIKPYLTVESSLNINFVSPKVLQVLLKKAAKGEEPKNYKQEAEKIAAYCAENKVEKLSKLNTVGVGLIAKDLEDYVTTHSTYLLIEATASSSTTQQQQKVKVVVKKIREDKDDFKLQIIDWWEG